MYLRLANVNGWKAAVVGSNETDSGGTKDAILEIKGEGAYDALRWESRTTKLRFGPSN